MKQLVIFLLAAGLALGCTTVINFEKGDRVGGEKGEAAPQPRPEPHLPVGKLLQNRD